MQKLKELNALSKFQDLQLNRAREEIVSQTAKFKAKPYIDEHKWREAVIDELVVCCIYNSEHDKDPRKAIRDIIEWNVQVALDPQVSEQARALCGNEWQPIETAPKDNKTPLYLARFDSDGVLKELDYDGIWEYWEESWELSGINGYCWKSANGIEEPTHWAYQRTAPPAIKE
jgi:hypothetical protein